MRKTTVLACLLATLAPLSHAEGADSAHNPSGLRPFLGLGFTSGGDTLIPITVVVRNSSTRYRESISSGGGLDLRFGLSQRLGELPLTLQLAGVYHNDQDNGIEGSKYRFRRLPVEATLLWHATDRARIGFGVRKATNAVLKIDNGRFTDAQGNEFTASGKAGLKASLGWIVEAEYALTPGWSLKGRYVFESFRFRELPDGEKFEANHIGIQSVWYLN